jgi:hypothetical protein
MMCWLKLLCCIPWDLYYNFGIRSLFLINLHHKFHGSRLAIILVQNLLLIGFYGEDMNVIHLFVLFKHQYCVHCLDTNYVFSRKIFLMIGLNIGVWRQ